MEKCALLFQVEEQKVQRLQKAFSRLGIDVKRVEPEEYGLPLGLLAGLPGSFLFAAGRPAPSVSPGMSGGTASAGAQGSCGPQEAEPEEEMLVFSGITRQELDRALDAMRRKGVSGIALKAMLTETNRFWNARQLVWELRREHAAMHAQKGIAND